MDIRRGWVVVASGTIINLFMGISYSWSVFADGLVKERSWSMAEAVFPFTIFMFVYAITVFLAGNMQDRYGPRPVIMMGGVLTSLAFVISGLFVHPVSVTLSIGFLYGIGCACTFSTLTPTALKWFSPSKRGTITGVSVSTLGLSPLLVAPVAHFLLGRFGVASSFIYIGIFFSLSVIPLGWLIQNPPYLEGSVAKERTKIIAVKDLLDSRLLYLWLMFCLTSANGLMVVSHLVKIAEVQAGVTWGYLMLPVFGCFNSVGRLVAGAFTDRFGVYRTVNLFFFMLTGVMALFYILQSPTLLLVAAGSLGLSYGSLFSLFPVLTIENYGLSFFGTVYGLIFTSLSIGGLVGPFVAGWFFDRSGSFTAAYIIGIIASVAALIIYNFYSYPLTGMSKK